jgi:two-component system, chemotaxis family, protein-glutamate methylesterase/glutaminase
MNKRDIVVIGSSAGGVYALQEIVEALPADFGASIFVVQHVAAHAFSILPQILTRRGHLKAVHPEDEEEIRPGHIYVAPPNLHMLIEDSRVLIKKGPKENRFRPSIDALFRSAAYSHGPRVIGVILTGMLDDGTSGMWSVKRMGGIGIIQRPDEAKYPAMPQSVLENVEIDHIKPLSEIPDLLLKLIDEPVTMPESPPPSLLERMKIEIQSAASKSAFEQGILSVGDLSPLTCPECSGVLVKIREGNIDRYRCHTGHSFLTPSLVASIQESVETNLWEALQNMEELVMLFEHNAKNYENSGDQATIDDFLAKAAAARNRAKKLREFIHR